MKEKTTKKRRGFSKLIPAACMLLISATTLVSSTYAWFTMNKEVTVTGMEMKTVVGDSLLIAPSTASSQTKASESAFKNALYQNVYGVIQPVSTINASDSSFYWTYDATADGKKASTTDVIAYNSLTNNEITVDTNTYKGYIDYVFEIKAVNPDSSTKYLNLTDINLLYDGVAINEHSYRVAVWSQNIDSTGDGSTYVAYPTSGAAAKIFAPSGFTYFDGTAVSSTTQKAAVSPTVNASGWSKAIAGNSTDYTKFTVRFWLEGEDTDCFSEKYLTLTKEWTLDLKFNLQDDATGADNDINSAARVVATASGATLTGPAANAITGETIVAYQWYKDNPGTLLDTEVSGATSQTYTATADGDYYCVVTTNKGAKYRTNALTVDV